MADFTPKPVGWDQYYDGRSQVFFLLTDFHEIDLSSRIEPAMFIGNLVQQHSRGISPTGKFEFPVPTVCGRMERMVTWEDSWAVSFTHQLKDVIRYDNEANGRWPQHDSACKQLIDVVIPRLLGALESGGHSIKPVLIHGDLWENNVGIDKDTHNIITFDAGSTYAHNEMEFGTWRCWWATHFRDPMYMKLYQDHIEASEPKGEWDDRNRLYSIHPYLNDSAGHPGSISRRMSVLFPRDYNQLIINRHQVPTTISSICARNMVLCQPLRSTTLNLMSRPRIIIRTLLWKTSRGRRYFMFCAT